MVKKTNTRSATGVSNVSLGYVVNDEELLDEILGEYDKPQLKRKKTAQQALKSQPAVKKVNVPKPMKTQQQQPVAPA